MTPHKHCYGTMFNDNLHYTTHDKIKGKVFAFDLGRAGLTRSERNIKTDMAEWDDCLACPDFGQCYQLCMAKLTLEIAVSKS